MKWIIDQVLELERKAHSKGLSMRKACGLAGVEPATFCRWKNGTTSPRMKQFAKLHEAIENYSNPRSNP